MVKHISKIVVAGNNEDILYRVKDEEARESISSLEESVEEIDHATAGALNDLNERIDEEHHDSGTIQQLNAGTDEEDKVWAPSIIHQYVNSKVANATHYRGTFDASSQSGTIDGGSSTFTSVAEFAGDVYIANTGGTFLGVLFDAGDSLIFKNDVLQNVAPTANDFSRIQNIVNVVNSNPTLVYGTTSTIGTVEGVNLQVTTPNVVGSGATTVTKSSDNSTVTISSTDTTYSSLPAAENGTTVSLVTTGDKYTWNQYSEDIASITTTIQSIIDLIEEKEHAVSAALNDLQSKINDIDNNIANVNTKVDNQGEQLASYIETKEKAISASLGDLDKRLKVVE